MVTRNPRHKPLACSSSLCLLFHDPLPRVSLCLYMSSYKDTSYWIWGPLHLVWPHFIFIMYSKTYFQIRPYSWYWGLRWYICCDDRHQLEVLIYITSYKWMFPLLLIHLARLNVQTIDISITFLLHNRTNASIFFSPNFIVVQVQFSAFSPYPGLTPSPPHLPPISTPPLLSMCPL